MSTLAGDSVGIWVQPVGSEWLSSKGSSATRVALTTGNTARKSVPLEGSVIYKVSDSMSEQILGAGVDRRAGGGAIKTAAQWQWGDAENAFKDWASLLAEGMYAYTSGEKKL